VEKSGPAGRAGFFRSKNNPVSEKKVTPEDKQLWKWAFRPDWAWVGFEKGEQGLSIRRKVIKRGHVKG